MLPAAGPVLGDSETVPLFSAALLGSSHMSLLTLNPTFFPAICLPLEIIHLLPTSQRLNQPGRRWLQAAQGAVVLAAVW